MLRKLLAGRRGVVTWGVVGQLLPIAAIPVSARLLHPEDFGLLAIAVAIGTVIGAVIGGRYDFAIQVADDESSAEAVFAGTLVVVASIGAALMLLVGVATAMQVDGAGLARAGVLAGIGTGAYNAGATLSLRRHRFAAHARASVTRGFVFAASQVAAGLWGLGADGMIAGYVLSGWTGALSLVAPHRMVIAARLRDGSVLPALRRFRKFPLFSAPSIFASTLAQNILSFLISGTFGLQSLGVFSMIQRGLGAPSAVIGNSLGQLYNAALAEARRGGASGLEVYRRWRFRLSLSAALGFGALGALAPVVVRVGLGDQWAGSEVPLRILLPLFAVRFAMSALSGTNGVYERQGTALAWQVILLALSAGSVIAAQVLQLSFVGFVSLYSVVVSAHYLILDRIMVRVLRSGD